MEKIAIDPLVLAGTMITIIGVGFGWYIVRLDHHVERLRDEVMRMQKQIGSLESADNSCIRDQNILKQDMSRIRSAILKMITSKSLRRALEMQWTTGKESD